MKIQVFKQLQTWKDYRNQLAKNLSLGLVPTMGNLHVGHLSLIEKALGENDKVLVTIFVNPKQFGPGEDFEKYPRTLDQDLQKIQERFAEQASDVLVFAPSSMNEIYPQGFSTSVQVKGLTDQLCGSSRPGHFEGVTTVVYKLFSMARAHKAYFGQKDYQQFKVIERMVIDLDIPISLETCPIIRDKDGLALSSRNQYLSSDEKEKALGLISALKESQQNFDEKHLKSIQKKWSEELKWDYLEARDADDLSPLHAQTQNVVVLAAAYAGSTRLIDNLIFKHPRGSF